MSMIPFFITGLPRCRTAWLANFLTTQNAFCWHDAMAGGWSARHVHDRLWQARLAGACYCGDADSGLLLVMPELHLMFPEARWLFVYRSPASAAVSFRKYFTAEQPYPGVPATTDLDALMAACHGHYRAGLASVPASRRMEVGLDELEDAAVMERVWRWLVPGLVWDPLRYQLLNGLQVNVMARKVVTAPLPKAAPAAPLAFAQHREE